MKIGTWISTPEDSVAGFRVFETVSPFNPGSVCETVFTTNDAKGLGANYKYH